MLLSGLRSQTGGTLDGLPSSQQEVRKVQAMSHMYEMANVKTFPSHHDRSEFYPNPDVVDDVIASLPEWRRPAFDGFKTKLTDSADLRHRVKTGYGDPMTVCNVLAAMIQSHPRTYLRAHQMKPWLLRNRPEFIWEAVAIGRAMGEIVDLAADTFPGLAHLPVDRSADWRGYYVVIDPDGGTRGRAWLMKLYAALLPLAQKQREDEAQRIFVNRLDSVWTNVDTSE